jgi:hypothetical protein
MPAVIGEAVHMVDAREGPVLVNDFGRGSVHGFILVIRSKGRTSPHDLPCRADGEGSRRAAAQGSVAALGMTAGSGNSVRPLERNAL